MTTAARLSGFGLLVLLLAVGAYFVGAAVGPLGPAGSTVAPASNAPLVPGAPFPQHDPSLPAEHGQTGGHG